MHLLLARKTDGKIVEVFALNLNKFDPSAEVEPDLFVLETFPNSYGVDAALQTWRRHLGLIPCVRKPYSFKRKNLDVPFSLFIERQALAKRQDKEVYDALPALRDYDGRNGFIVYLLGDDGVRFPFITHNTVLPSG